jgi:hypothetical protein
MTANETQVGGDHYKDKAIQPWDYITGNEMAYLEGCIVKYISRHRDKGGLEDLHKARHYLDKLIEVEEAKTPKVSRAELLKEIMPAVNEMFGTEYEKHPITDMAELARLREKADKAAAKFVKKNRKSKAPYGLKADGTPYQRKPRNWKE